MSKENNLKAKDNKSGKWPIANRPSGAHFVSLNLTGYDFMTGMNGHCRESSICRLIDAL
jgi:hypothetical protein